MFLSIYEYMSGCGVYGECSSCYYVIAAINSYSSNNLSVFSLSLIKLIIILQSADIWVSFSIVNL